MDLLQHGGGHVREPAEVLVGAGADLGVHGGIHGGHVRELCVEQARVVISLLWETSPGDIEILSLILSQSPLKFS